MNEKKFPLKETTNAKTNKIKAQINLIAVPGRTRKKRLEKRARASKSGEKGVRMIRGCCYYCGEEWHDKNLRL
jgi:hypothetical protein